MDTAATPTKPTAAPYETRREYALQNYRPTRLAAAVRIGIAILTAPDTPEARRALAALGLPA